MVELNDKIVIGDERKKKLMSVLQRDAEFFQKHLILDYSLLVGIHYIGEGSDETLGKVMGSCA